MRSFPLAATAALLLCAALSGCSGPADPAPSSGPGQLGAPVATGDEGNGTPPAPALVPRPSNASAEGPWNRSFDVDGTVTFDQDVRVCYAAACGEAGFGFMRGAVAVAAPNATDWSFDLVVDWDVRDPSGIRIRAEVFALDADGRLVSPVPQWQGLAGQPLSIEGGLAAWRPSGALVVRLTAESLDPLGVVAVSVDQEFHVTGKAMASGTGVAPLGTDA